jgi:predicted unusual protein kinase regulating ubiquinone biosynthesis (AarF/ABC1/UbiB family)
VYFGRAAALAEGVGVRYDPEFNAVQFATPIVRKMGGTLLATTFRGEARDVVLDVMSELSGIARELRDVLRRAGRDELRVRAHPRDVIELQQFLAGQTRRILLCVLAGAIGIIGTMLYIADHNLYVLAVSIVASFIFFAIIFVIPVHLLSNPLRGYRRWR